MEISLVSRDHPDESVLEEYVFGRLSGPKTDVLQDHLLICERCQVALTQTEDYIRLFKFAASNSIAVPRFWAGQGSALVSAGVLAAACLAFLVWPTPNAIPVSVSLASFRGGAVISENQAAAGHPLDLSISAIDVPLAAQYSLEMVTSSGESIWRGPASSGNGRLSAHVSKSLRAGQYWVRLYARPSELLAEYGLQVE